MPRCSAITTRGTRCRNNCKEGDLCAKHTTTPSTNDDAWLASCIKYVSDIEAFLLAKERDYRELLPTQWHWRLNRVVLGILYEDISPLEQAFIANAKGLRSPTYVKSYADKVAHAIDIGVNGQDCTGRDPFLNLNVDHAPPSLADARGVKDTLNSLCLFCHIWAARNKSMLPSFDHRMSQRHLNKLRKREIPLPSHLL